jgi:RTX toxin acyltransferase family
MNIFKTIHCLLSWLNSSKALAWVFTISTTAKADLPFLFHERSPLHKHLMVTDIEWLLMPPIMLNQFHMWQDNGRPHGFASWAYFGEEQEERIAKKGIRRLMPTDWKTGEALWLIDFVAPLWRAGKDGGRTAPQNPARQTHEDVAGKAGRWDGRGGVVNQFTSGLMNFFVQTLRRCKRSRSAKQIILSWQVAALFASIAAFQFLAPAARSEDKRGVELVGKCFELKTLVRGAIDSLLNICFKQKGVAAIINYGGGYGQSGEGKWRASKGIVSIDADDVSVHEACKFQFLEKGKKLNLTCGWTGQWRRTK